MSIEENDKNKETGSSIPFFGVGIFMESCYRMAALQEDKKTLNTLSRKYSWQQTWNTDEILLERGEVIIVTDPFLHIVFASSNILEMNGYTPAEVLHKSPRKFQGKETDKYIKNSIGKAIKEKRGCCVSLINYKKNNETYLCRIDARPVFNKDNRLVHFIAFEQLQPMHE